ncbi:MAG: extracellular solute-binding protein [Clostridia bacterium]|nr:extracellular solute-binding protein [Clostridia bacterium]
MKKTRLLILALVLVSMLAGLLAGCSKPADTGSTGSADTGATTGTADTGSATTGSATTGAMSAAEDVVAGAADVLDELAGVYPIEGNLTFTYWVPIGSTALNYINSYAENVAYQVRAEKTGVTIEFNHPPVGSEQESFNLMIAGGELPDIIESVESYYKEGIDAGIDDGYFLNMNELVKKFAPAYTEIVALNDRVRKEAFTDGGYFRGFAMVSSDTTANGGMDTDPCIENPWTGVQWNTEYLEACNLDVPETIDDWTEAFAAFKAMDPECTPLLIWGNNSGNQGFNTTAGSVITAYGIAPGFYQEDGVVKYGFAEPALKDYLILMKSWYDAGYIHEDFSSMDSTQAQTIYMNGKAGCFWQDGTGDTLKMKNAGYKTWTGGVCPRLTEDSEPVKWSYQNNWLRSNFTLVTTACEHPEEATRWLDWGYTTDGYLTMNFGREGETYYGFNELGECQYVELYSDNNHALWDSYNSVIRLHNGCYLKSDRRSNPRRFMADLEEMRILWESQSGEMRMPPVTLTTEEGSENASIMADVEAYRNEMIVAFIRGTADIEAQFDEYLETIKGMGIDKAIANQQAALERFNAR